MDKLQSEFQEASSDWSEYMEDGMLSDWCVDPGLSLSRGRSVMAEPDYLEGDCEEMIKPKKLLNPVKGSRNHQDLHRELMMNQKMGLAPQNKPELQKVLELRKREQVLKAQREEQEAHTKRSDLEIELMKRQQKLEQLELDQQKDEEEQENTPEFVKMKSNLRRTKQEANGEERTT
ncbi:protein FAM107B-like isoform 1-T1 [Salvelinus alpinus]